MGCRCLYWWARACKTDWRQLPRMGSYQLRWLQRQHQLWSRIKLISLRYRNNCSFATGTFLEIFLSQLQCKDTTVPWTQLAGKWTLSVCCAFLLVETYLTIWIPPLAEKLYPTQGVDIASKNLKTQFCPVLRSVWPAVHTNPSRKRSFSKPSRMEEFENDGFAV